MKQFRRVRIFLLLLTCALAWPTTAVSAADESVKAPPTSQQAETSQPVLAPQTREGEDMRALRQRYGKDPTGVRARLGMCRRGHGGGHGMGHGRGNGHGRGPMHGTNHPCADGEQPWNKKP